MGGSYNLYEPPLSSLLPLFPPLFVSSSLGRSLEKLSSRMPREFSALIIKRRWWINFLQNSPTIFPSTIIPPLKDKSPTDRSDNPKKEERKEEEDSDELKKKRRIEASFERDFNFNLRVVEI